MTEISQEKFKAVGLSIPKEAKNNPDTFIIAGTFFTLIKYKGCWLQDLMNMKYFKVNLSELNELVSIVKWKGRLFIMEGFYDKSLNTSMYKDIQKCTFLWNDIELDFEDIERINVLIKY